MVPAPQQTCQTHKPETVSPGNSWVHLFVWPKIVVWESNEIIEGPLMFLGLLLLIDGLVDTATKLGAAGAHCSECKTIDGPERNQYIVPFDL